MAGGCRDTESDELRGRSGLSCDLGHGFLNLGLPAFKPEFIMKSTQVFLGFVSGKHACHMGVLQ